MFHEYILYRKYIKTSFLFSNMHCQELYLGNFKSDFLNFFDFFAPSGSRFSNSCISAKYCPILTNHTPMKILFIQLPDGKIIYSVSRWSINLFKSIFEKLTLKTGFVVKGIGQYCIASVTVINAVNYHCITHMYYLEKTWKTHKPYRLHVSSVKFYACYSA